MGTRVVAQALGDLRGALDDVLPVGVLGVEVAAAEVHDLAELVVVGGLVHDGVDHVHHVVQLARLDPDLVAGGGILEPGSAAMTRGDLTMAGLILARVDALIGARQATAEGVAP